MPTAYAVGAACSTPTGSSHLAPRHTPTAPWRPYPTSSCGACPAPAVAARCLPAQVPHSTASLASYLLMRRIFSRLTRMIPWMVPTPSAETTIFVLSESSAKFLLP